MTRVVILVSVAGLLTACEPSPPALSGWSEEALTNSVEAVRADLEPERRAEFDSLMGLVRHNGEVRPGTADVGDAEVPEELRERLTGLRLEGLRSVADSLRCNHLRQALEATRTDAIIARMTYEQPIGLEVVGVRGYRPLGEAGGLVLEITLENRRDEAVFAGANFKIEQVTPGRTLPYNEATTKVEFRGGLEPGERRTFRHEIPRHRLVLQNWSSKNVPSSAELRLQPYTIYGPEGEPLTDAMALPDTIQVRIDSLREQMKRFESELEDLSPDGAEGENDGG